MQVRLQKYLADAGVASRRKCEQYILEGSVLVNGEVVSTLGAKVDDETDIVKFNESVVKGGISAKENLVYIMLHKPKGYITSVKDENNRKTVMDLLKNIDTRVFPIGRLDFNSSGLLILTNDGNLAYKITHPKFEVKKEYFVRASGSLTRHDIDLLRSGVMIDGKITAKSTVTLLRQSEAESELKIIIQEGRNRQVRKMLACVGCNVTFLKRVSIGSLELGLLPVGNFRYLSDDEIGYLRNL